MIALEVEGFDIDSDLDFAHVADYQEIKRSAHRDVDAFLQQHRIR